MPVIALYEFNEAGPVATDSAVGNGAQNGTNTDGALGTDGRLVLDGVNDKMKVGDEVFQLDRGTLEIQFAVDALKDGPQTILSRDSAGQTEGGYRIEVLGDGSVLVTHEAAGSETTYTTGPGFLGAGDEVNVSYSWDAAEGGKLIIENQTAGTTFDADTPAGLTMDMGDINQQWMVGAGQSASDPWMLNNLDKYMEGSVEYFQISDTVDNVGNPNGDPVAQPDVAETDEDTSITIPVLANDTDPDGDTLELVGTPTAGNGTVTVNEDGTITYTPNADFNGEDTITYTVTDPSGATSTSTVTVTVNPVNDDPLAQPDVAETDEDTSITIPVLDNDTDPDGDTLELVGTPTAGFGTVTVNDDGTVTYTPNANFTGEDTITYTVTDPSGATSTSTVTVTVNPVNDDPVAVDDAAETPFETPVVIDVLGNDTDVDGDTLVVSGTPTSPDGTVTVNEDGTLTFTPNDGFEGEATITYTIDDGNGGTDEGTVTVLVGNDPVVPDGIVEGTAGGDLIDNAYDGDPNGDFVDNDDSILDPGPNDDRIYGYGGDDTVIAGTGDDLVFGGQGNDDVDGGEGDDSLLGNSGDDTLAGAGGNDTVAGGDGNDDVDGGAGDDSLRGGAGDDTLRGADGNDIVGGGDGNDDVEGGDGDDSISGGIGDDTLRGGDGNDTVRGADGNDVIDTRDLDGVPLPDRGYPGLYPADSDPSNDLDLVSGGRGDDVIRTGDDNDTVFGGRDNDFVDGGFDDDQIKGGFGNDTIIGGEGADTIEGRQDDDLIYGGYGPGVPDDVNIPDDTDLRPDNGTDLIYGGFGNDTIYGLDDDDTIYGGADNDLIDGGIDEDEIHGDRGNDTIIGGLGVDTMYGGADRDVFIVTGTPGQHNNDAIDGNEGGDDFDTLDLTGAGRLRIDYERNPENGTVTFLDDDGNETGTLTFKNIENVIPCFTPGTLIATPKGEVPVEGLRAGDQIITRDNGIQTIRWLGARHLDWAALSANPHLKPILIRQGSLGNGLPERDMMVSPNHRMLVANDRTALYFAEHEVLVAAKHLTGAKGVQAIDSMGTTYLHFMFDRHEVVLANGSWTESFQPGDQTLKGMGNAQRNEIFELFPELREEAGIGSYAAARRTLKKHEASLLLAR